MSKKRKKGGSKKARRSSRGRPKSAAQIAAEHRSKSIRKAHHSATVLDKARRALEEQEPLVTFVVPTLNRPSLTRALTSLSMQTSKRWSAIVVGDGMMPDVTPGGRIEAVRAQKCGSAGVLRNIGMKATQSKAPWFAFLDDDDLVTPDYVQRLEEEIEPFTVERPSHVGPNRGAEAALIVFRMTDKDGLVKPSYEDPKIERGWVGISFAVRREWPLEHGIEFIQEEVSSFTHEDIAYVKAVREAGGVIHVSDHMVYRVRGEGLRASRAV